MDGPRRQERTDRRKRAPNRARTRTHDVKHPVLTTMEIVQGTYFADVHRCHASCFSWISMAGWS